MNYLNELNPSQRAAVEFDGEKFRTDNLNKYFGYDAVGKISFRK